MDVFGSRWPAGRGSLADFEVLVVGNPKSEFLSLMLNLGVILLQKIIKFIINSLTLIRGQNEN